MAYELKIIDVAAQAKILKDSGEKIAYLKVGGGHFENNPALHWAVDEAADSYLFWSPQLPMDRRYFYYFFRAGRMYSLVLESESSAVVRALDWKSDFASKELRDSVCEAFSVYGTFGVAEDGGLKVVFKNEGEK